MLEIFCEQIFVISTTIVSCLCYRNICFLCTLVKEKYILGFKRTALSWPEIWDSPVMQTEIDIGQI